MSENKITPNIWFKSDNGNISIVIEYYKNIFGNNFECGPVLPLGETPGGKTEMCEVKVFGQKYVLLCTEKVHFQFNDGISFIIYCENQNEIDKYWQYFTLEGKELQCGWCIDKHGLRWQVLPNNLEMLMCKPNSFQVMMGQTKIIIEDYLK